MQSSRNTKRTVRSSVNLSRPENCGNFFVPSSPLLSFSFTLEIKPLDIMTTMAAAVAASLPTVQTASTPVVPTQETLPASWNKSIDAEAEIPITTVQIDGLVCLDVLCRRSFITEGCLLQVTTKIIKHSLDSGSNPHGLVLGLDLAGVLEVSNCFPLPNQLPEEDDKSVKSVGSCSCSFWRGRYSRSHVQLDINRKCCDR